jgi:hypothetical protein
MVPILLTQTIILFQDTSLVYAIGAYDLLKASARPAKIYGRPEEALPAGCGVCDVFWPVLPGQKKLQEQNCHHSLNIC